MDTHRYSASDIDAVYVPLPTGIRKQWVIRAAEAVHRARMKRGGEQIAVRDKAVAAYLELSRMSI